MTNALTLLEIFLINKNYVACDHLTIADISILTNVTLLEIAVEFDLTSYPNIWNWFNRLRSELPYYERLTKVAHDELRALIQSVRDVHEEWSTPLPRCAFTSSGGHSSNNCIIEQQQQYQRLFLSANDHRDAARIMAAVSPVFGNAYCRQNDCRDSGQQQPESTKQARKCRFKDYAHQKSLIKRIRLTIEPNPGQMLPLSHFETALIE